MLPADADRNAVTALRRFGLGARPGERQSVRSDPRGFLAAQLSAPAEAFPELPTTPQLVAELAEYHAAEQQARAAAPPAAAASGTGGMAGLVDRHADKAGTPPLGGMDGGMNENSGGDMGGGMASQPGRPHVIGDLDGPARRYRDEAAARLSHAATTGQPFIERLAMFWSNVFCVATDKSQLVRTTAGAFEREAIRPYVRGRFADMLRAATRHPAMLAYLDNDRSVGPHSLRGLVTNAGLNENLARETLELHSVGVDGGYSQADVTALARALTGWRSLRPRDRTDAPDGFVFDRATHEPGSVTVMGRAYAQAGAGQCDAILADLAVHPATARHVARRLAIHFVADDPPPALVGRLETRFRDTGGDLAEVARALIEADETWTAPPKKVLPPYDLTVAALRMTGQTEAPQNPVRVLGALGQPLWQVPSPKGWPEEDEAWAAPDALLGRLDFAVSLANRIGGRFDVRALADDLFGEALAPATRQAVARAERREQALALLIAAPDVQRR